MNPTQPTAQAVAISGDKISAVGDAATLLALAGPQTEVTDYGKATILPGFVESHLHLVLGGAQLSHLDLCGITDSATAGAPRWTHLSRIGR